MAVRKDSPLVLGLTEDSVIFASDVSALLEWTKNVVYLKDYDVVVAKKDGVESYNLLEGGEVSREVIPWSGMWSRPRGAISSTSC